MSETSPCKTRTRTRCWLSTFVVNRWLILYGIAVFRGIMMWLILRARSPGSVTSMPSECEFTSVAETDLSRLITAWPSRLSPPVSRASRIAA